MTIPAPMISLGPNGPLTSCLGIGTWAWGDKAYWTYGKDYDDAQLEEAFQAAIAQGVTLFDTAEVYGLGESERLVGQFLRRAQMQASTPIQIATKYFPLPWRWSAQAVREALTASLTRLGVNQVALYQVHWPFDFFMGQPVLMAALAEEVQRGRIQCVGVSNYSAAQMRQAHRLLGDRGVPLAVNQVQYSLLERRIETNGVLDTARELGVMILAYSPLAQGLLTGKYSAETYAPPTGARRLNPRFSRQGLERLGPLLGLLREVGQANQHTPAQVALNWLIAQEVVPIPGAKNARQAQQNAGALGWSLTVAEREAIAALKL